MNKRAFNVLRKLASASESEKLPITTVPRNWYEYADHPLVTRALEVSRKNKPAITWAGGKAYTYPRLFRTIDPRMIRDVETYEGLKPAFEKLIKHIGPERSVAEMNIPDAGAAEDPDAVNIKAPAMPVKDYNAIKPWIDLLKGKKK